MALTVTLDEHVVSGNSRIVFGRIAFDSSYPTGGEALTANDVGLGIIDEICFSSVGRFGCIYYSDTSLPATTLNVEVLCPSGGSSAPTGPIAPTVMTAATGAVPSGTTATTLVLTLGVGGRGLEMGNAADCSTLTNIRFVAWGK